LSNVRTLKSLDIILESFLERVIAAKEERLSMLDGLNSLDELARASRDGDDVSDKVADWMAQRREMLVDEHLRTGDVTRIDQMLGEIGRKIKTQDRMTPGQEKVSDIIAQWRTGGGTGSRTTLKRGPEAAKASPQDSIALFASTLDRLTAVFSDLAGQHQHLLSILDDTLKSAEQQKNREALLLSALLIYYLKQGGYKVSPYVKRLKEAELLVKEKKSHA
jgi:hypothetical protein